MIKSKFVQEKDSAYIKYHLLGKRGLFKTIFFGNLIFFFTVVYSNLVNVFPMFWILLFYVGAQAFVFLDHYYGKRVGRLTFILKKNEVGIAHTTGDWTTDYRMHFPLKDVSKVVFHESTFLIIFFVEKSMKKFSLNPDIPIPLIAELLEITGAKTGILCIMEK